MRIAVGQLRPRVGDADHRPAVEDDVAEALGLQPRAMHEPVEIGAAEPVAAARRVGCHEVPRGPAALLLMGRFVTSRGAGSVTLFTSFSWNRNFSRRSDRAPPL